MARIQVLELPTVHHGDDMETPFVLIIDQVEDVSAMASNLNEGLAQRLGARALLAFAETIDIPANGPAVVDEAVNAHYAATKRKWQAAFPQAGRL